MHRFTAAQINPEFLRFALDRVPAHVYIKDADSRYIYANQMTLQLFGVSAETLLGKCDADFFPPEVVEHLREIDLRVLAGERTEEEITDHGENRARRVFWEVKVPLRADGDSGPIVGILGISTDISEQKLLEDQLRNEALHDSLTDLPNRRLLFDRLSQAMIRSERENDHGAILVIDVNDFKALNDSMGHEMGDEYLVQLAKRLQRRVRAQDTVARFGGDEFVVLLEGLGGDADIAATNAGRVARKVEVDLGLPYTLAGREWETTASVGMACFSGVERSAESIIGEADKHMYVAKNAQRKL